MFNDDGAQRAASRRVNNIDSVIFSLEKALGEWRFRNALSIGHSLTRLLGILKWPPLNHIHQSVNKLML
jgi:hypothetical protein